MQIPATTPLGTVICSMRLTASALLFATAKLGWWALGTLALSGPVGYAIHKRKYIQIAVLKLIDRRGSSYGAKKLAKMCVYERDRDVARAADHALKGRRDYRIRSSTHYELERLTHEWALKGDVARVGRLLGESSDSIREGARKALARVNATATQIGDGYISVLSSSAEQYPKSNAIYELEKLGDKRAIKPLIRLMDQEDISLVFRAEKALKELGASKRQICDGCFAAILRFHRADDSFYHANLLLDHYVKEIAEAGDKRAIKPLLQMLGDADERNRSSAENLLAKLGASRRKIVKGYIEVLSSRRMQNSLRYEVEAVRIEALETLAAVIKRLATLGDKRAMRPLAKLLAMNSPGIRVCVREALEQLATDKKAIVNANISALSSKLANARVDAAKKLENLGDRRAIRPLLKLLQDEEGSVRTSAQTALTKLGATEEVIDIYLGILRSRPRSADYWTILDYFVQMKASRVVQPLIGLIYAPQPGFEVFYKQVLKTIGKIGDKSAIDPLKRLLDSRWRWVATDHKGRQIEVKQTGSEWIRQDILATLEILREPQSPSQVK